MCILYTDCNFSHAPATTVVFAATYANSTHGEPRIKSIDSGVHHVESFFFFQAEDGIRDFHVTGVQTCGLPISENGRRSSKLPPPRASTTTSAPRAQRS